MANKYLDSTGLATLWNKIKALIPQPSSTTPSMDGSGSTGSGTTWARADHVHPSDTSRVPTTRKVNGKALSADISLTASDVGALSSSGDLITAYANDGDSDKNPILHVCKGDTFGFVEGTGISITPSSTDEGESYDHQLQIAGVAATTSSNGLMSSVDKTKLNGIASGAQVNVLEGVQVNGTDLTITNKKVSVPLATNTQWGVVKVLKGNPEGSNTYMGTVYRDGSSVTFPTLNGEYVVDPRVLPVATTSSNGAMSSADKTKLDGLHNFELYSKGGQTYGVKIDGVIDNNYTLMKYDQFVENGMIKTSVLPSFVDDVVEAYPRSGATALSASWLSETSGGAALTPATGKIYILMADSGDYTTNTQFRWSGSAYVKLNDGGVSALTTEEINAICV